jgi:hypothetical protein
MIHLLLSPEKNHYTVYKQHLQKHIIMKIANFNEVQVKLFGSAVLALLPFLAVLLIANTPLERLTILLGWSGYVIAFFGLSYVAAGILFKQKVKLGYRFYLTLGSALFVGGILLALYNINNPVVILVTHNS